MAEQYHVESLKIRRSVGDQSGISDSLHHLGNVSYSYGDYEKARQYYEESLALSSKTWKA